MNSELRCPAPDWSVDQLRKHFGMIPAERILRFPPPGTATEKDAVEANERDGHVCELIDGTLVEKAVGANESRIAAVLLQLLGNYLDQNPIGDLLGADGFILLWPGLLRAPDVSFFRFESLPRGSIPETAPYPAIVPDLAVEVRSKTNTAREIDRKIQELFSAGTKAIWVIDPRKKWGRMYSSPAAFEEIGEDGVLRADKLLPDFAVPLSRLLTPRRRAGPKS